MRKPLIFSGNPETILDLIEENQLLLKMDGATHQYLSVRAVFRLATLLPHNYFAQECVCQLLNIALKQTSLFAKPLPSLYKIQKKKGKPSDDQN